MTHKDAPPETRQHEAAKAGVMEEMVNHLVELACNFKNDEIEVDELLARIREAVAPMLASARVPDGWQLVPVESTDSMRLAFDQCEESGCVEAESYWLSMLAAAPKLEGSSHD